MLGVDKIYLLILSVQIKNLRNFVQKKLFCKRTNKSILDQLRIKKRLSIVKGEKMVRRNKLTFCRGQSLAKHQEEVCLPDTWIL